MFNSLLARLATVLLEMKGLNWATEKAIIEATLGRLEGVRTVDANPVAQTAVVVYDPSVTNVAELRRWIEECGFHCAGQSVPAHMCHPMDEPRSDGSAAHGGHPEADHDQDGHDDNEAESLRSPIGRYVLKFNVAAPFGLRDDVYEAIRALLDLAPPMATVLRDGETLEVPTAELQVGADTALAQIVKLVQEAQNSKAPGQRLADRAAFRLVFVALIGGTGTFLVWSLSADRPVDEAILFAITVVVITCPDALGLATPIAIMVGTGLGARRGAVVLDIYHEP